MRLRIRTMLPVGAVLLCLAAGALGAQGKPKTHKGSAIAHAGAPAKAPGHAKKVVITTDRAVIVTREVLVKHGYEVVRIERSGGAQIVYFRRGNMGRGRGKGPVERMIIRPYEERVVFEATPRAVLVDLHVRLGL